MPPDSQPPQSGLTLSRWLLPTACCVFANLLLFALYCSVGMFLVWLDVRSETKRPSPIPACFALLNLSAIPVASLVNGFLLRPRSGFNRVRAGLLLGVLVVALATVPYFWLLLTFYFSIGGQP